MLFILLGGKLVCKVHIPGSVTKCQGFSDLPSSKSKISGPLASSHFPFGSSTLSSPASSWPPRCLLTRPGVQFKSLFFQTLLFRKDESPKFQDKPRLRRTHFFLLKDSKTVLCFEETLEIPDLAKGAYLLPTVIFLCEYTFVRGILFLYLDSAGFFLLLFSNYACLIPLTVNESLMWSLKWRKKNFYATDKTELKEAGWQHSRGGETAVWLWL